MASRSTTLSFDFDIFSMAPMTMGAPRLDMFGACRSAPSPVTSTSAGETHRGGPSPALPVGLVDDHALREEATEGLVEAQVAGDPHGAGEEARVEKVKDRVLDAADILVDRQPGVCDLRHRRRLRTGRGEAGEIPGRVDEGVHRVRLAASAGAAGGTGNVLPRRMVVERVTGPLEGDVVGQLDRQLVLRHRHDAAGLAAHHRDGAAPVALARQAPVAQAEVDFGFGLGAASNLGRGQAIDHRPLGLLDRRGRQGSPN